MIIDLRTYTIRIGAMGEFLAKYARDGLPVQTEHLGAPLAYCTSETGEQSQVVHIWQYTDMADRERRRAMLEADPRWLAYRNGSASLVLRQENRLLRGVDLAALAARAPQ
jgi:hypothetical protein